MALPRGWLYCRNALTIISAVFWTPVRFLSWMFLDLVLPGIFVFFSMFVWVPKMIWGMIRLFFRSTWWGIGLTWIAVCAAFWTTFKIFFAFCATLFFMIGTMHLIPFAIGGIGYVSEPVQVYQDDIYPYLEELTNVMQDFIDALQFGCDVIVCTLKPIIMFYNLNIEFFIIFIHAIADEILSLFKREQVLQALRNADMDAIRVWMGNQNEVIEKYKTIEPRFDCWFDPLTDAVETVMHAIFYVIMAVVDAILWALRYVIEGLIAVINFLVHDFIDFFENFWDKLKTFVETIMDAVTSFIEAIISIFSNLRYTASDAIGAVIDFIQYILKPLVSFIFAIVERFGVIEDFIFSFVDILKDVTVAVRAFFYGAASGLNLLMHTIDLIRQDLTLIINFVHNVIVTVINTMQATLNLIKPVFDRIKRVIDDIIDIVDALIDIIDVITSFFREDGITPAIRDFNPANSTNCVKDCYSNEVTLWMNGIVDPNDPSYAYLSSIGPESFLDKDTNTTTLSAWVRFRGVLSAYAKRRCVPICAVDLVNASSAIAFSPSFSANTSAATQDAQARIVSLVRETTKLMDRAREAIDSPMVGDITRRIEDAAKKLTDVPEVLATLRELNLTGISERARQFAENDVSMRDAAQRVKDAYSDLAELVFSINETLYNFSAFSDPVSIFRSRLAEFGVSDADYDAIIGATSSVLRAVIEGHAVSANGTLDREAVRGIARDFNVGRFYEASLSVAAAYASSPEKHSPSLRYINVAGHLVITALFNRARLPAMRSAVARTPTYEEYADIMPWLESYGPIATAHDSFRAEIAKQQQHVTRSTAGEEWVATHLPSTHFFVDLINYAGYFLVHTAICFSPLVYCPPPQSWGVSFLDWLLYDILLCVPDVESGDYCFPLIDVDNTCQQLFGFDVRTGDVDCRSCDFRYYVDELSYDNDFFQRLAAHYKNAWAVITNTLRFGRAFLTDTGSFNTAGFGALLWQQWGLSAVLYPMSLFGISGATFAWIDSWAGVGGIFGWFFARLIDWTTFPTGRPTNEDFVCLVFNSPSLLIATLWTIFFLLFFLFLLINGFLITFFATLWEITTFPIATFFDLRRAYKKHHRKQMLWDLRDDVNVLLSDMTLRANEKLEYSRKAEIAYMNQRRTEAELVRGGPVPPTFIDENGNVRKTPKFVSPKDDEQAIILDAVMEAIRVRDARKEAMVQDRGLAPVGARRRTGASRAAISMGIPSEAEILASTDAANRLAEIFSEAIRTGRRVWPHIEEEAPLILRHLDERLLGKRTHCSWKKLNTNYRRILPWIRLRYIIYAYMYHDSKLKTE